MAPLGAIYLKLETLKGVPIDIVFDFLYVFLPGGRTEELDCLVVTYVCNARASVSPMARQRARGPLRGSTAHYRTRPVQGNTDYN